MGQFKTKKTILYFTQKKTGSCRRFYGVVFSLILIFGLFNGFLVKSALADNNYIDNIKFYKNSYGYIAMSFHVKTTFTALYNDLGELWGYKKVCRPDNGYFLLESQYPPDDLWGWDWFLPDTMSPLTFTCQNTTYQAGHTYEVLIYDAYIWYDDNLQVLPKSLFSEVLGMPNSNTIFTNFGYQGGGYTPLWTDTEIYHFTDYPNLTISFPQANAQMTGAFYIDGTYSVPSISDYPKLIIWFTTPENITYPNTYKNLTTTTGTLHEKITNLPAGNYTITFIFSGNLTYEFPLQIPVQIVNDIPPELPTGETPPTIPAFGYTPPDIYYPLHSNYATATALFNDLTASVGALISNVGNSLSAFAGKFTLTDAQNTGTTLGNSISTIRSYAGNLNSFFGNLPVSQILIFYIIIFIAVIVFRLVKNLVNLIKP
jgi:hypothetical protein